MIEKERIEAIKAGVDLTALVTAKGIELKKNGKSYFGLCPFHDDHNPSLSVNPTKNLWQCFGCGAGGDAIRFVELFDQIPFPEALKQLEGSERKMPSISQSRQGVTGRAKPANPAKTAAGQAKPTGLTVKERKLLGRVVSYYQHTLTRDSRGIKYLNNDRGITDNQSLKDFGVGSWGRC